MNCVFLYCFCHWNIKFISSRHRVRVSSFTNMEGGYEDVKGGVGAENFAVCRGGGGV